MKKSLKNIIIINLILLLLISYFYVLKYFPNSLHFSSTSYRSVGGDGLTKGLFPELLRYALSVGFYMLNGFLLINYFRKKNKKGMAISLSFIFLLVAIQIGFNKAKAQQIDQRDAHRYTWVKTAKAIPFTSNNLKISFTYVNKMPVNKKVSVAENNQIISVYTEGNKGRADKIIRLKKDANLSLKEQLIQKNKANNTAFYEVNNSNFKNKELTILEMPHFNEAVLKIQTNLSFDDLNISNYREIENVYFIYNSKYPTRYYVLILRSGNQRPTAKPRLETYTSLDGNSHYIILDKWYNSIEILKK